MPADGPLQARPAGRQGPNGERIIRAIIRDEVVNGGAGRGFAKAHGLKRPGVRT